MLLEKKIVAAFATVFGIFVSFFSLYSLFQRYQFKPKMDIVLFFCRTLQGDTSGVEPNLPLISKHKFPNFALNTIH